jgi:hypothetical protein
MKSWMSCKNIAILAIILSTSKIMMIRINETVTRFRELFRALRKLDSYNKNSRKVKSMRILFGLILYYSVIRSSKLKNS